MKYSDEEREQFALAQERSRNNDLPGTIEILSRLVAGTVGKPLSGDDGELKVAAALSWTGIPRVLAARSEAAGIPARAKAIQGAYMSLHDDQASWSRHSRSQTLTDSSHCIQFDRPDVVIQAVGDVVDQVQSAR